MSTSNIKTVVDSPRASPEREEQLEPQPGSFPCAPRRDQEGLHVRTKAAPSGMLGDADALFVEEDYEGALGSYTDVSAWRIGPWPVTLPVGSGRG